MKKKVLIVSTLAGVLFSCTPSSEISSNSSDIDRKVDSVLALMTLEEKVGQMNQQSSRLELTGDLTEESKNTNQLDLIRNGMMGSMLNVYGAEEVRKVQKVAVEESRLGIPIVFGFDVIHGYKTGFPIPLAESCSWDLAAMEKSARIAAIEASAAGLNWTFAPMVDIARDARWGRIMEGAGEDPWLGAQIAKARVKGFQGDDLSANNTIAACAKHLAGYGYAESGRDYNSADISERTLMEVALPPFKAAAEAGVATMMNSFNEIGGIPATGHRQLQRDILKGEWDFQGFVVSDWASIGEMMSHGHAKDLKHAAEIAANAGSDMDMEANAYRLHLAELVKEGKVKESYVDDAVRRILKLKFQLGLFEDPYKYCSAEREKEVTLHADHLDAALDAAKKSIVLLKNEENTLPLSKDSKKIAVIGQLADDKDSPIGTWRGKIDNYSAVSVLEGLKKAVSPSTKIAYDKGTTFCEMEAGDKQFRQVVQWYDDSKNNFASAKAAARGADAVLLCVGEIAFQSGEGRSQTNIELKGRQAELIKEISKVNDNIILVLINGRPLALQSVEPYAKAIVEAWHVGLRSGDAIAQVLFGDYNPSGKLTASFPRVTGQVPIYYSIKQTGRMVEDYEVDVFKSRFIDCTNDPLYVFGHGLSYSTFEYSDIKLSSESIKMTETLKVSVDVTNSSKIDGEEVVQLYIRDLVGSATRPIKQLKGFEKILIKARETQTVEFELSSKDLEFWTQNRKFEAEPGDFKVFVGSSSKEVKESSFTLE